MRVITTPHVSEQAVPAALREAFGDPSPTESSGPGQSAVDLPAGVLVTSLSTNAPGAHEIPPAAVPDLDVYVDARSSLKVATELVRAAACGWDPDAVVGDLAGLVAGRAPRPSGRRPVYFRSVGLGIEDAAVAWAAYQNDDTTTEGRP